MIYSFESKVWKWENGKTSWFFASIPVQKSNRIKQNNSIKGYGMVPVIAKIGQTQWKTSVFFDSKRNHFIPPIKAEIRRKNDIKDGENLAIQIEIIE